MSTEIVDFEDSAELMLEVPGDLRVFQCCSVKHLKDRNASDVNQVIVAVIERYQQVAFQRNYSKFQLRKQIN